MTVARNRAVWWPVILTALFVATYLVPVRGWLFDMQLYRLSGIGAPAFLVFRELSSLADLAPLPNGVRSAFQWALLLVVQLCWFPFICLPFWSDFRVGGLSVRSSRFLFAIAGVIITAICWLHLGGWRVHDA